MNSSPLRLARPFSLATVIALLVALLVLHPLPATAAGTGTIIGTVTNDAGEPLEGIRVDIMPQAYMAGFDATTKADGTYRATVPAGKYRLAFTQVWGGDVEYVQEIWDNKVDINSGNILTVTAGKTSTVNAKLSVGATISGHVTDASGKPLVNASVLLLQGQGLGKIDSTDSRGAYTINGVLPSTYKMEFHAPDGKNFAHEYWDNSLTEAGGKTITVRAGELRTGVNAQLAVGAMISGTVTDRAGKPVKNVGVWVDNWSSATTDASGRYRIMQLQGGTYTVTFENPAAGIPDGSRTTKVTVAPGKAATANGLVAEAKPTISGTAKVGQRLTANPDVWRSGVTLTYQWLRDGSVISRATGSTYTLTGADTGKKISVKVTGEGERGVYVSRTSAQTVAVAKGSVTPKSVAITGTAKVGGTLTASRGTWSPSDVTYKYQWLRDGAAIKGATAKSYTIVAADAGKRISVKVTGSATGYTSTSKTSAATAKVAQGTLATVTPNITGTPKVGSALTAAPGTWKPSGVTYRYQWLRDGKSIGGATAKTYKLTKADGGRKITVKVTGSKGGYTTASKTSAAKTIQK